MAGLDWPGVAGPGIEVIQYRHRYAVVAPSLNDLLGYPFNRSWAGQSLAMAVAPAGGPGSVACRGCRVASVGPWRCGVEHQVAVAQRLMGDGEVENAVEDQPAAS